MKRTTSRRLSRVSPACEISAGKYRPVEPRNTVGVPGIPGNAEEIAAIDQFEPRALDL